MLYRLNSYTWCECGASPHVRLQQTSSTERKAQALVPVCCFVNKAIIGKAGNKYAIRKRNPNKS